MTRVIVKTSSTKEFFGRAREAARLADDGRPLRGTLTLSFESPERMFSVLSAGRRKLMARIMEKPMSVSELSRALRRDRATIAKDVKLLQESGLVLAERKPNPGHGVQTIISPIAKKIDLVATLAG